MPVTIWDLITAYRDETGATEAWIMRKAGLNKGAFTAWRKRGVPVLPDRPTLFRLAETLRADYETVVMAMLHAGKYLPESIAREDEQRRVRSIEEESARVLEAHEVAMRLFAEANRDFGAARALASELHQTDELSLELWERVDDNLRELEQVVLTASFEGGDGDADSTEPGGPAPTSDLVSEPSAEMQAAAKKGQVEQPGEFDN